MTNYKYSQRPRGAAAEPLSKAQRVFPDLAAQELAKPLISPATWAWIDTATDLLPLVLVSAAINWAVGDPARWSGEDVALCLAILVTYRQHRARQKINQLEQNT